MTANPKKLDILLQESFVLHKENFLGLLNIVVLPLVPLIAFYRAIEQFFTKPVDVELMYLLIVKKISHSEGYLGMSFCAIILTFIALILCQIALMKRIDAGARQRDMSSFKAYQEAFALLGPYFLFCMRLFVKIFLWSLCFILPGVYFSMMYSLSPLAFTIDGKRGRDALDLSKKIMQLYARNVIGYTLIVFILMLLLFFFANIWLAGLFGVNEEGEVRILPFIGEGLFVTVEVNLVIYMTAFMYFLYNDLKNNLESKLAVLKSP